MSKRMKIGVAATIIIVAAILAVGLVVAGKDYVSPEGVWNLAGGEAYEALAGAAEMTFEFKDRDDLIVTVTAQDTTETVTGRWDVVIDELFLTLDGETTVCDYEIVGDTLTIINEEGSAMILTRAEE